MDTMDTSSVRDLLSRGLGSTPRILALIGVTLLAIAALVHEGTIVAMLGVYGILFLIGSLGVYLFPIVIKLLRR